MATVAALKRLAGRLNGLLGREEEDGREEVITAGDFRIDLTNHRVQVRGQRVELTGAEFDLLPILLGLRKKLEASGASTHYIRIEPWIFYRFDPAR
jgi:DNA-binding response OmpR family regulator